MSAIDNAIAAIESREAGASFSYRKVAAAFGVDRTTLSRRHQGLQETRAARGRRERILHPQQEYQLIQYLEGLTERGLPPSRSMIQNFASSVVHRHVGMAWVTRFLHRNDHLVISKWTTGIDRERHQADSGVKYTMYFDLLHQKLQEYDIEPENTYNMDEKGFLIGITTRSKRVFSKQLWEAKQVTAALQDGNREWVTVIACICGDGSALDPALIYEAKGELRNTWVSDVEVGKHQVFMATSPSGWSNNELGLAWLEQVFNRSSQEKARRRWRLLILDGHGSHVTADFIDYCDAHKILLMVFPPHSTHTLQPLDVVMFKPLSSAYSAELTAHLHRSQGLLPVKKSDFFALFWKAWTSSFTQGHIYKAFEATGIIPLNADVILKRFNHHPSGEAKNQRSEELGDGSTWNDLRRLFEVAVKDTAAVESKQLSESLHSLQVQNELLHHENDGLRAALTTKRKQRVKSKRLDLQQRKDFHGGAVFWSPRKIREARTREKVNLQEEALRRQQKAEQKEIKAAATAYKKQQLAAAKEAREIAKLVKEKERQAKAERLAHARREKQQQKDAATAAKALQLSKRGNQTTLKKEHQEKTE
jgi:hypothetical protein